ncbi:hypothetical protein HMPREF9104_02292 [Lentilactobacillus kisonensis F0435]|uniref:Uncharacterized protein n=1 Tax=Lentilactobacillus kisonensis F0435 TaxID=797516 RepID=H1LI51_9LACO|nr:hypothetical protein HMPREF9104_02292 [Lentilactobacillus kisonensis F0435]
MARDIERSIQEYVPGKQVPLATSLPTLHLIFMKSLACKLIRMPLEF